MAAPGADPTPEQLIEALADAGEVDAGVEVFDALRMHDPAAPSLVRLQARLFAADEVSPEQKRIALAPWCDGALDVLVQKGALLEAAVGCRVMARVFPEEPSWAARHALLESVIAPLPNAHGDPARTAVDRLIARGATADAWEALRSLAAHEPHDAELSRRVETLRELLFSPADTRPYQALLSDSASLASRVQQAVRAGDLHGALVDASTLADQSGNPRWVRYRDALRRLVEWSTVPEGAVSDEEVTTRTGPLDRVDLWLRAGNLAMAREAMREQLTEESAPAMRAGLEARLAELDVVLDGTLPTPVPARPPAAAVSGVNASLARVPALAAEDPASPPEDPSEAPTSPSGRKVQGTEDTEPARPQLIPQDPTPSSPPSQPPVAGDVKVGKRKIVRLS